MISSDFKKVRVPSVEQYSIYSICMQAGSSQGFFVFEDQLYGMQTKMVTTRIDRHAKAPCHL
jgi:hypothetical protein